MPITGHGWELLVERLEEQKKGPTGPVRTKGTYAVFIDGKPQADLAGWIYEAHGPGSDARKGVCVATGTYRLFTQFGARYESVGYCTDMHTPGKLRMPGIRVEDRGIRSAILIHPAHPDPKDPDHLYLSSVGCLNPGVDLAEKVDNEFWDSRARVIALLDSLTAFDGAPFARPHLSASTLITGATIVIEGKPQTA